MTPGDTEEFHRLVVQAMSEGVVVQDSAGRIAFANASARRILGRTFDEMRGGTSAEDRWGAVHPDGSPWPGKEHPASEALPGSPPGSSRCLPCSGGVSRTRGISERLFISLNTARNHVQRTIAKLGAHSRLEAVAIARRYGLLLGDPPPG